MSKETKKKFTNINELGEFGLIQHLTQNFSPLNSSSILGVGDDAAILKYGDATLVMSTDLLVEHIHFDLNYVPLKHLGYKSVVVNLSDIYAMNATPRQITLSLALSSRFTVEALEAFYSGVELACRNYGVDLVGGDTTSSRTGLTISITAIGEANEKNITKRDGAQVEDYICVSGDLGAAYLGLQILEREKKVWEADNSMQPQLEAYQYIVERQLKPEARKDIIQVFAENGVIPNAMIDLSDGLSSDLMHICKASELGAELYEENIPIHPQAHKVAFKEFKISPTTCALSGGEDYELLFTLPKDEFQKIDGKANVKVIGKMLEPKEGIKLYSPKGQAFDLIAQGWNHFKQE